jgi:2-polyprenyl-6-methoxyphenol hydroxylase-like FAD-dependent oxidoreductase
MEHRYDAIVIGARCAGSPLGMLLARQGHRVLIVDRATFPSDVVSTHVVHPPGVAALARWGLLERLTATGCPPIHTYAFDFGAFTLAGAPGTPEFPVAYCPRRTILDSLLVGAAADSGADVREGFVVENLLFDDGRVVGIRGHAKGGRTIEERAAVVVGADGRNSLVAEAVNAPRYHERPPLLAAYYAYWSGLPMNGRFETYALPNRGAAVVETHDGLTIVIAGWLYAEFVVNKRDVERHYLSVFDMVPAFAERLRGARRATAFAGATVANFFRKPFGPGWALAGDAGYNRDFITAQGITDAFHDAERVAHALDQAFTGRRAFDEAMSDAQRARDERVRAMYEFTCQLATLAPPPPEMQQLFQSIHGNQPATDAFVRMNAGTISPEEFMAAAPR